MEPFASKLRERAVELGISHAEAARRSGLGERRYGHYVAGIREPDLATLVRIAEALATTPDILLGFGDRPQHTLRDRLSERLLSAASRLTPSDFELIILQTEAIAAKRSSARKKI